VYIEDKNGETYISEEELEIIWKEYLEELYGDHHKDSN
jgi:hypothetical protein